jgi:hypothetical protein
LFGCPFAAADGVVKSEESGRLGDSEGLGGYKQGEDGFHDLRELREFSRQDFFGLHDEAA